MFMRNPSVLIDLAELAQRERIQKSTERSMVAEAIRGGAPRVGIFSTIRRAAGSALIGAGKRVHGEREIAAAQAMQSDNAFGLAR